MIPAALLGTLGEQQQVALAVLGRPAVHISLQHTAAMAAPHQQAAPQNLDDR